MKSLVALLPALLAVSPVRPAAGASPQVPQMLMPAAVLKRVSSGFGYRHDGFHPGLDLAAPYGSPVRAALPGKVVYAGWDGGYGKLVALRSADGLVTRYAHLSHIAQYVTTGQSLDEGETLGNIGTTGNSRGAHLHFEVLIDRRPINPAPYLSSSPTGPVSVDGPVAGKIPPVTFVPSVFHIGGHPAHLSARRPAHRS